MSDEPTRPLALATAGATRPRPPGSSGPRAVARLARQVELALGDLDLSLSQYRLLLFLDEVGSAVASALAGRLEVTRPSVTALVDGLESRSLVERHPQTADRRRIEVVLNDAGRELLARADAAVAARLAAIAGHLPADRAGTARQGLDDWSDALDTMWVSFLERS